MIPPLPQVKDLVLVGGGHAHVHVLKAFAMQPVAGLRITLITREADTPYSGMVPGHVNGTYSVPDVHIDLLRLARFAGARLFVASVTAIDTERKCVSFGVDRELRYDLLSINTGAAPNCPFDLPHVVPVKPIGKFLPGWHSLAGSIATGQRLAVVGGGAGGFEIALAAQRQLGPGVTVSLLTAGRLLPEHHFRVRTLARAALAEAGVELRTEFRVSGITPELVVDTNGAELPAAAVLWVTGVSAPDWLQQANLTLDADGFIEVDRQLRSTSAPEVYAGGDVAGMRDQPRPKAGVFAVRQGGVLARNLRADVLDKPEQRRNYKAQSNYLALLNCADGTAIASYGSFAFRNGLLWQLKDRIDSAFIDKFNKLPDMSQSTSSMSVPVESIRSDELGEEMRCGGCGSKINATLLKRVLRDLDIVNAPWVLQGIGDDAAVLKEASGSLVLTTDGFRSMLDDTRLFGRIATHHALSDIYAMGAQPNAVLANVTVPLMSEAMMEAELRELLTGVLGVLGAEGVPLVGGHSAEGAELSVSLTVTGKLAAGEVLTKSAGQVGDALILTKPLGSGCVLAANMRGECDSTLFERCVVMLDTSNKAAAEIVRAHGARALTDVTGFGLAGHLHEMLGGDDASLGADLWLEDIPVLTGAETVIEQGIVSSLHAANAQALAEFEIAEEVVNSARLQLLADPQTSGGLLAAVPPGRAGECVEALREAGYGDAAVVGVISAGGGSILPRGQVFSL